MWIQVQNTSCILGRDDIIIDDDIIYFQLTCDGGYTSHGCATCKTGQTSNGQIIINNN